MMEELKPSTNESERLRELIRELGLPLKRLPEILSEKRENCLSWWSRLESDIQIEDQHFTRLAGLVGIDENQLFIGEYDRDLARRRLFGDYAALPERYQGNQNSFLRTSSHIVRYMVLTRGQWFADQVLSSLNVSPLIYQDVNQPINLTYFADLLAALAQRGFSQNEMDTLASVIFLSLQETPLGQDLSEAEDFYELYSTLAKNLDYFDFNFEYKSQFVGKKYYLTTTLPLEQHKYLKDSPEQFQRLMRYRHILTAWFPYLAGMSPLFPKAELIRSGNVVEVRYEFILEKDSKSSMELVGL